METEDGHASVTLTEFLDISRESMQSETVIEAAANFRSDFLPFMPFQQKTGADPMRRFLH